jgi:hypothetical protein
MSDQPMPPYNPIVNVPLRPGPPRPLRPIVVRPVGPLPRSLLPVNALWECTNGWCGCSYLRVYVWAATEAAALAMARDALLKKNPKYGNSKVEARLLFKADAAPFATEPSDEGWPE